MIFFNQKTINNKRTYIKVYAKEGSATMGFRRFLKLHNSIRVRSPSAFGAAS